MTQHKLPNASSHLSHSPKPSQIQFDECLSRIEDLQQRVSNLEQENITLSEAVAARDTFLAVAAHELRNPITPIVGRIDLLRRALPTASKEKIEWSLDQIDFLISRFVKRSTALLDVSRLTSAEGIQVKRETVEICALVRLVVDDFTQLARLSNTELSIDAPAKNIAVMGDALAIEQILDNLVSNAIKYAGGKPVTIAVKEELNDRVAVLSVSDNGPGISPENASRIFERFERAVTRDDKAGGFGVGLWVVKRLCEAMDGTIKIGIGAAGGSTFSITLPLAE